MVVFKRKQIVVLSLVLMIMVAGYLQYSYKRSSISVNGKDSGKIGEAVYVENTKSNAESATAKTADGANASGSKSAAVASKQANDFFAQAKLDREVTRSKNTDELKKIAEDASLSKEEKTKAYDQMVKLASNSDKEMRIENLIKEKGYLDAIVLFGDDGSLDVVIKSSTLTAAQAAQIADIVSRQANVAMDKIHIRNIF
ncbi:MAG: SpoIIIAH-like family protein [Clostridiales bacterium]|jgi:stage III sporulation protein AH|nr:SpoIIIAH-like family protein [Eubacteriales bacterium]MDH7565235.1 SpoIIIAH-like family protein [Clostridiales bacterium]